MDGQKSQSFANSEENSEKCLGNSVKNVNDEYSEDDDDLLAELSMELGRDKDPPKEQLDSEDNPGESHSDVAECKTNVEVVQFVLSNNDKCSDDAVLKGNSCVTQRLDKDSKEYLTTGGVLNENNVSAVDLNACSSSTGQNTNVNDNQILIVNENVKNTETSSSDDGNEKIGSTTKDVIRDEMLQQIAAESLPYEEDTDNVISNTTVKSKVSMDVTGNFVSENGGEQKTMINLPSRRKDELMQQISFQTCSSITVEDVPDENIQLRSVQPSEGLKSLPNTTSPNEISSNGVDSSVVINTLLGEISSDSSSPKNEGATLRSAGWTTLAEDAKLVKFSVPTKPLNLMQSNAQFLNKGRNFLNFITEKSTNIMEKTLLPQNLTVKYNSILKLTDANDAKYLEESCTSSESSMTDLTSASEMDLKSNSETSNQLAKGMEKINTGSFLRYEPLKNQASGNSESVNKAEGKNLDALGVCVDTKEATIRNLKTVEEGLVKQEYSKVSDQSISETSDIGIMENQEINTSVKIQDENETLPELQIENVNKNLPRKNMKSSGNFSHEEAKSNESTPKRDLKIGLSNLLEHPAYMTLLRDYTGLKGENQKFNKVVEKLEKENHRLEAENSGELYAVQLETLEKTIEHLRNELKQATTNQEILSKQYAAANRERESMVMKYAVSEKQLIDTQRAREYADRRAKDALKEQELLQNKLKQVQGERTRICNILDTKCHELSDAQKEVDRVKEDLNMREVKLKWAQNKLKTEMDVQKETQQKLEKALTRINGMKEECEQVHKQSQEMIRKFQQSEENKAVTLDQQLKEQQARLILERHVTEDKEMSRLQLQKEVDLLKQRQQVLIEENNTLSLKVQHLEKERLNYESNLSNLKIMADQRQKEVVDLVGKVSQLETLKLQLKHKEQCLASNEAEVERLRRSNNELQVDMEACRQREAHMLDFTQKLTDKNVRLQSEFTSIEAKAEQLEMEQGPMRERIKELTSKVRILEESLTFEKNKRTEECELLAKHVAEQTQLARNLTQKLEDSQGENAVLRRKQQISLREMTRELQQCRKRLEAFEAASPTNSLDPTSRTGSSTSLNTGDTLNGAVSDNSNSGDHTIQSGEPDRQTLIDRIVKLQRINVRRAEKLDFLEEHTRTLVEELRKKARIIQHYIMHENPDAMGSNARDRNKAELAKHGGIMASVFNHRVSDDNMTLELSLEINQKLQAVLEDTLLKNITLKDSIDTLGGEIARLTMQNKRQ